MHDVSSSDPIVIGAYLYHIAKSKKGGRLRDTLVLILACKLRWGQDHRRLNSKLIAQHIFTMVKADPTISIMVLQGGVENHFGYKASYRKVWLAKQRVIARIYGDWKEDTAYQLHDVSSRIPHQLLLCGILL